MDKQLYKRRFCLLVCVSVRDDQVEKCETCIHDVAVMIVYGPISTQDDHILIGSLGHLLRSFVRTIAKIIERLHFTLENCFTIKTIVIKEQFTELNTKVRNYRI